MLKILYEYCLKHMNHEWPLQSADQNKVEGLFVLQLKRPLKQEENNKSKTNSVNIFVKVI